MKQVDGIQAYVEENTENDVLLEVDDLRVEFVTRSGVVTAVNGLSYSLHSGEVLAILGESGSGKSVAAQAVMRILTAPPARVAGGAVRLRGEDLLNLSEPAMRRVRGQRVAMIFQDALSALNPVQSVGYQIGEMFRLHRGASRGEAKKAAIELMERVRIPNAGQRVDDYPHEFSGGMRQRVMIAMALALEPEVLIADEPTTALDVTVQAQIMRLLKEMQERSGMGLVLITHDLGVVAEVADRVCVMYAGRAVEQAPVRDIYVSPAHPYTLGLMQSIPRTTGTREALEPIEGQPPNLREIPDGCEFQPRCPFATDKCRTERPQLVEVAPGRQSACHYWREVMKDGKRIVQEITASTGTDHG